ncbi:MULTISPECIES: glycoside hydrolase family 73 protein [Leuconostoc]|uniref:N-acetylmuramidase n=2 Tax=Leuconostoc kimchii TaxID=136609 RepID=D5T1C3_LEUKI|nr:MULTISPECIES: glycoside hydrolase family 73 protein [Leuconostoc]ADG40072.1 N-acetylmuramidase [Leuconostoc kimchii IMSNU 11154]AEJ30130.1 N-acetylmuramidase [Leuconostoc sp. C2]QBR47219.1 N-acetylmuramidase [Leuconostoc kimchii]
MAKRKKRRTKKKLIKLDLWLWVSSIVIIAIVATFWSQTLIFDRQQSPTNSQADQQKVVWINQLAPYAREMQEKYGVIASISIAQAILESDWHTSTLSTQYNNLYGIKADKSQKSVVLPTQEFENGQWITIQGRFASYDSWQESMKAHAELLYHGTSWNTAQYQHVLKAKDYQTAAVALTQDGYATDPTYAKKLIAIIEEWHLSRFDIPK